MYVYSVLPDSINQKLGALTGLKVTNQLNNQPPAVTVLIRRNRAGGVDDPVPYITNPEFTLVIAGKPDERGMAFSDAAVSAGVPEENVFFIMEGQSLSVKTLAERISELTERARGQDEDVITWDDDTPSEGRIKTLGVLGYRGGVGRTTISTSLAAHYTDIGEKVVVVDLGSPPSVYRHTGAVLQEKGGVLFAQTPFGDVCALPCKVWDFPADALAELVNGFRYGYRRVIVDFPAELKEEHLKVLNLDRLVVIVDSDVVQSVEPVKKLRALYVYNKAVPEVDVEVISAVLGAAPIVIRLDLDGCYAALAAGQPAYRKSEAAARGIGELAAEIERS